MVLQQCYHPGTEGAQQGCTPHWRKATLETWIPKDGDGGGKEAEGQVAELCRHRVLAYQGALDVLREELRRAVTCGWWSTLAASAEK